MFDAYGADAMRWMLLSSPILRGADFSVTETGIRDTVRHVVLPFWNAYYFLTLYANAEGKRGRFRTDQTDVLDRYLMGELRRLVDAVTAHMDEYDLFGACEAVATFLDTLTNWYIRRSRDRFWAGDQDAIDALAHRARHAHARWPRRCCRSSPSTCTSAWPVTSRAPACT